MIISSNSNYDQTKYTKDLLISFVMEDSSLASRETKLNSLPLDTLKYKNDIYYELTGTTGPARGQSCKTIVTILKKPSLRSTTRFKTVKEAWSSFKIVNRIINKNLVSNRKIQHFKRKVIDKMNKEELNKSFAKDSAYAIESIVENINMGEALLDKKTMIRIEEGYSKLKKLAESYKILYREDKCLLELKKLLSFKDIHEESWEFDNSSRSSKTDLGVDNTRAFKENTPFHTTKSTIELISCDDEETPPLSGNRKSESDKRLVFTSSQKDLCSIIKLHKCDETSSLRIINLIRARSQSSDESSSVSRSDDSDVKFD
jgi:hypothetical protein